LVRAETGFGDTEFAANSGTVADAFEAIPRHRPGETRTAEDMARVVLAAGHARLAGRVESRKRDVAAAERELAEWTSWGSYRDTG
jgi:hypothetical protein